MKYKKYLTIAFFAVTISSCKKDYTCQCTNANGTYDAGQTTDTEEGATTYCKSLSSTSTNCDLKK